MTPSLPKLRTDLTVSEQQTADGLTFVLKDPAIGEFFRLREVERFIAEQLDGETPLDVVRQRTEERFGATLASETLTAFVGTLERAGLLEVGGTAKKRRTRKRSRIRGSPLYLRFALFDPDSLFERLVRRVRFCFTPHFMVLSGALILLGVSTTIANWTGLAEDVTRLYRLYAIPLLLAVTFVVASAHEFAHGLTCKRFGGEVHEIGFLLLYFQPAFYCNLSDAWLFSEKAKRLWVSFAGPYFELFLWAVAALVWRLTEADTRVNYLALMVMAVSGIKTLLNFNPFIKLDGYYLLSDYLDIPNLRRKSFRYVGQWIKTVSGWTDRPFAAVTARERRIYLIYGVLATLFSFALLGYATVHVGGLLIENSQPIALAFFVGLLSTRFRRRLGKLFGGAADRRDVTDASPPERSSSDSARSTRSQKTRRIGARRITWLILTGAVATAVFFGRMELRIAGPFTVLPIHNADVRTEIEGLIEEVYVTEGDEVRAGDVVARLSDRELRAELQTIEAQIQQTRAQLRMLEAGPTRQQIALARAAIKSAEDRLKYGRARLERSTLLLERGLVSRVDFEKTQELAVDAENEVTEATRRLELLLSGARPEEIDAANAEIARLETQQRYLTEELSAVQVRSPARGIVATPARQLHAMVGQLVQKGALIAKVYDLRTLTVQIAIPEKEIADIKLGQEVVLKARAYPNDTFHGTVMSIATTAHTGALSSSGDASPAPVLSGPGGAARTILVTTEIDNPSLLLKPGMTGHAKVLSGQRRIVELVMRRLARTIKVEFWSWW